MALCEDWGVGYSAVDYSDLCNFFIPTIISNIEANKHRKEDIRPLICDESIQEIVRKSNPLRADQKLFRIAIINKNYVMLDLLTYIKRKIKRR